MTEFDYVYRHDCPAFGKNAIVPRALVADKNNEYVLFYQHKCPMCSHVAGERELAPGVTENPNGGFTVDTSIAERLRNG